MTQGTSNKLTSHDLPVETSATRGTDTPTRSNAGLALKQTFRSDIEGLRALAVCLVLLYHAAGIVPGGFIGVDIFFVISGFLITGLLLRDQATFGHIRWARFYARRVRRLLPASFTVLLFIALVVVGVGPSLQRIAFGGDIATASIFAVNWRFADRAVDYLAQDIDPSPILHFWSLSVEEQFYVIWPLVLILALVLARRMGWSFARISTIAIAAIGGLSFAWSILATDRDAASAFFVTPTRMWELAVGALIAMTATTWLRLGPLARQIIGALSLIAIGAAALSLSDGNEWPGYLAVIPVLGAAGVIVAGLRPSGAALPLSVRLLSLRPLVWVGGISYSLYLWHWPMLVGAAWLWGPLTALQALFVVALAFVPAYASKRWIEDPVRRSGSLNASSKKTLSVGAALIVAGVVIGGAVAATQPAAAAGPFQPAVSVTPPPQNPGVAAPVHPSVIPTPQAVGEAFTPVPADAKADRPIAYDLGCQAQKADTQLIVCDLGDVESATRIVLVGDSKILQWYDAFDAIGKVRGWHVQTMTKTWCAFMDAPTTYLPDDSHYPECDAWNRAVLQELIANPPDAVFTSSYQNEAYESPTSLTLSQRSAEDGYVKQWDELTNAGIKTTVLFDNPTPPLDTTVYECVQDHPDDWAPCSFDRAEGVARSGAAAQRPASERTGVESIDMSLAICPTDTCEPIINSTLVYRDTSHLTVTYVKKLIPLLAAQLDYLLRDTLPTSEPQQ